MPDLAVAQPFQVAAARVDTDGDGDVVHLLGAQHLGGLDLPGVENLAPQGHDRLEVPVPGLLGGAAGGITLHQKELGARSVLGGAIRELPRQGRPRGHLFAHDLLAVLHARLGVGDGDIRDAIAGLRMLVEPEAECILGDAGDEGRRLPGREAILGLAGELGVGHLDRQDVAQPIPDVVRGELHAPGQEAAELAVVSQGLQQSGAEPVHVGAALGGGDEIHVALLGTLAALRQPDGRPVCRFRVALEAAEERLLRYPGQPLQGVHQVVRQAVLVVPLLALAAGLVVEAHPQAGTEHGLRAQRVLQARHRDLRGVEVAGIRPEANGGAGVALAHRPDDLEIALLVATGESHVVFLAVALDPDLEVLRECVHNRDADAVQPSGEAVVLVGELTAGVQTREDELDAGDFLFGMHVDGHSPPVVGDAERTVLVQGHVELRCEAGDGLVNPVVDHLECQMVWSRGVRVHPGALAHRFQTRQYLDVGSVVALAHGASITGIGLFRGKPRAARIVGHQTLEHRVAVDGPAVLVAHVELHERGAIAQGPTAVGVHPLRPRHAGEATVPRSEGEALHFLGGAAQSLVEDVARAVRRLDDDRVAENLVRGQRDRVHVDVVLVVGVPGVVAQGHQPARPRERRQLYLDLLPGLLRRLGLGLLRGRQILRQVGIVRVVTGDRGGGVQDGRDQSDQPGTRPVTGLGKVATGGFHWRPSVPCIGGELTTPGGENRGISTLNTSL